MTSLMTLNDIAHNNSI